MFFSPFSPFRHGENREKMINGEANGNEPPIVYDLIYKPLAQFSASAHV